MVYYYAFLMLAALSLITVLTIMFAVRRNGLKNRLVSLRERLGDRSNRIPFSIQALKDEIFIVENELAARQI